MSYSIYVSGPIMAPNPDREDGLVTELLLAERKRKFHNVSKKIRDSVGSTTLVINPLEVDACKLGTTGPICEGAQNGKHTWRCYMRYDLEQLVMCHEIVMLEGWEDSPGAMVEFKVAQMLGLETNYWCDEHNSAHPTPCKEKK